MDAHLVLIVALAFALALAFKIGTLVVIARWLLAKIPDEPDYSASVVYSKVESEAGEEEHVL